MQHDYLFSCIGSYNVFNLNSWIQRMYASYSSNCLFHQIIWKQFTGWPSMAGISNPVIINKTIYNYYFISFTFFLVATCIICSAMQIPKNSFNNSPMIFPMCRHVPTQYSHFMGNIWLATYHSIHQTTYNTSIGHT